MKFEKENYTVESVTVAGETIEVRAFRSRLYVDKPVNAAYQQMNIFVPECYYGGKSINGYHLETAPIFMPNSVGGYKPGELSEPGENSWGPKGVPNTIFKALQHGYVVAVPAIRGRTQQDENGKYTGKAPACIVDYKAAVRYLRHFAEEIPGDTEKIITNGTSAGGALSALMGATGNHPDYEPYLERIGAAKERDDIFAASCYCPIINLENADAAYEWQFQGINEYRRMHMQMAEGGRPAFVSKDGQMTDLQIRVSEDLAALFPSYVNSLKLKDGDGKLLALDESGEGSFKEHMKKVVMCSAEKALAEGVDLSDKEWLTVKNHKVIHMDWYGYVKDITRMKTPPAFDALSMDSPENDLFGSEAVNLRHFTEFSKENSLSDGDCAEDSVVKMLNPMRYIRDDKASKASYWRIRHGECDRDTSLAISAMLTLMLENTGKAVDYHSPWNVPHAGDYDLEELFAWIDGKSKSGI